MGRTRGDAGVANAHTNAATLAATLAAAMPASAPLRPQTNVSGTAARTRTAVPTSSNAAYAS